VIADRGYGSAEIVPKIETLGAVAVIPLCRHWKQPRTCDRELYKQGNRIGCCFNRLEYFRRFSKRYSEPLKPSAPPPHSPAPGSGFSYMWIHPSAQENV
jgi:transposase